MDRVKQGVKCTQLMIWGWSFLFMFLMFFFGRYLTYMFVDPSEQDVVQAAVTYFKTVFWAYPFLGILPLRVYVSLIRQHGWQRWFPSYLITSV